MIAHVAGLPAEEIASFLIAGGAGLTAARGWVMMRSRRLRGGGIT